MMSNKILNWGLLSTAHINAAIIPPLKKSDNSKLLGVASRDSAKAREYAESWQIPKYYGSYEDLINDPEIDVIYNSLPNLLHKEWTIKALNAGKHVLCEKPIALTVAEVDEMIEASQRNNRVLTEAFMYRHHPQTLKVKELVDNGAIGNLQFLRGSFTFTISKEYDVRLNKDLGGGSVWDVGCYPVSFFRTITGMEPIEVFGQGIPPTNGVDERFYGQLKFPNDVYCQFDSGFRSPFRTRIEIVGDKGSIELLAPFKPGEGSEIILTKNDATERITFGKIDLYAGEIADINNAILFGTPTLVSLADSRANTHVINCLYRSAEQGLPTSTI